MTNPTPLTQDELKAAAYFAVGVTSEGSIGGRDMSYRLSFAGTVGRDGSMNPVGNSGYSFGTLQIDLGQHPEVARDLLDHYQQWATTQPDHAQLQLDASDRATMLEALQRTGRQMRAAGAQDIDRANLNRFLDSDDGRTFVHGLDRQHVEGVTRVDAVIGNHDSALERLGRTALYRNASDEDQARLAGLFMKLQNQSGQSYTPGLLTRIEHGTLGSADSVKTAIDGLLPNLANGDPNYVQSGADNTLRGVGVFNALRATSATNPMRAAWDAVVADPLIGPVEAHAANPHNPALGAQYDAVRSLFLSPEGAKRMLHALDEGGHLAEGNPALHNGRRNAGFFVSGHDFVHWNANGQGVACIDGAWRAVDPNHLHRVANRDGTVDLKLTENGHTTTLLHVDPHARALGHRAAELAPAERRADTEQPPVRREVRADDPGHADFDTYKRIHDWVRGTNHWDEEQSRNIAAALYREQAGDPLVKRVDRVAGGVGRDGAENVFAIYAPYGEQGPFFQAQVDGRKAALQPAADSLAQVEPLHAQQRQLAPTREELAPSIAPRALS